MPTNYKVLGQSAPSATTNTSLYTVPSSTETVVSTITICNRSSTDATFRIAIKPDNASTASQHYVAYDAPVLKNDTVALTLGITMNASDVIEVYASSASISFSAFGSELS